MAPHFIVIIVINNAPPRRVPAFHAIRCLHNTLVNSRLSMIQHYERHPAQALIHAAANRRFRVVCTGRRYLWVDAPDALRDVLAVMATVDPDRIPGEVSRLIRRRSVPEGGFIGTYYHQPDLRLAPEKTSGCSKHSGRLPGIV